MDETVQLLSQLCELNLALYRHPLHGDKDKARSQARSSSSESAGQASTQSTEDSTAWELSRSELGIGKLLEAIKAAFRSMPRDIKLYASTTPGTFPVT